MNRLFVDIGNSKLKWRFYIGESRKHDKCGSYEEFCAHLDEVSLAKPLMDCVKISSVKNNATTFAISNLIETKLNIVPQFAKVSNSVGKVRCGYKNINELGVDRWLAIVSGVNKYEKGILIVDSGTAISIDLVDHEPNHLGGFILPGLRASLEALSSCTDKIPLISEIDNIASPGNSTKSGVLGGIINPVIAFIELLSHKYQLYPVLTGGDNLQIGVGLSIKHSLEDNLVLDGLEIDEVEFEQISSCKL